MRTNLTNRHVVVTGAASGIGRATVLQALTQSARVTSIDLVDPQLPGITHVSCDVSNYDDWSRITKRVGAPDHLFLNAGRMSAPADRPAEEYAFFNLSLESYRRTMGVNVDGVVFGLRALAPAMPAGSSIVINSSLAGVHAYSHDPVYAMSKHAVVGLTKSLAETLADRGIRLNALCLNRVDTPLLPDQMRSRDRLTPQTAAADVLRLFEISTTGGVWGRTREDEDLYPLTGGTSRSLRQVFSALRRRLGRAFR